MADRRHLDPTKTSAAPARGAAPASAGAGSATGRETGTELELARDQAWRDDELATYSHELWQNLVASLCKDIADEHSTIHRQLKVQLLDAGAWLSSRDELRQRLDDWCVAVAAPLVNEYREKARDYIAARVRQWSAEEMSEQI